ncbi:MAG: sodium:proton antiporter NhaD [Hyphomicrobiales bacterium]
MVIIFLIGYTVIALEHPLKIDKAASAMFMGVMLWIIFILGAREILPMGLSDAWNSFQQSTTFATFLKSHPNPTFDTTANYFIGEYEIIKHLGEISEIIFFLLAAMIIVELIDQYNGFALITDRIKTTSKRKLLWILCILTFLMSAGLDNLTTTIVLIALVRKLVSEKKDRWLFASMIVLSSNAGGVWSPIGDVTTILLWIGGQITAANIVTNVALPGLVSFVVPVLLISPFIKGEVVRPNPKREHHHNISPFEQKLVFWTGLCSLLFVPFFKAFVHLPPFMGRLLGLSIIWLMTEIIHQRMPIKVRKEFSVYTALKRIDIPTVFFFLGILMGVSALQSAGHLKILSVFLNNEFGNVYIINLIIGVLSSLIDNVLLVAAAIGTYGVVPESALATAHNAAYLSNFVQNGTFWEFLAYTSGTGGSILIIGSAAGVAAMGMEKIDFIWYLKKISWLAVVGYLVGAGVYYLERVFFM